MQGASLVTLETALNYGKTACPTCLSSGNRTVYATRNGRYYHYSRSCAGSGAVSGTLGEAVAYGLDPCPYCVSGNSSGNESSTNTYTPGTSGIRVYATINGRYFHQTATCSGMRNASLVTLETALNYGKTACPTCLNSGNRTVYATRNSTTYHYSDSCERLGSGALAGTLAQARALGLSPCRTCVQSASTGGGGTGTDPSEEYSASADSSVYINLTSTTYYYHTSSRCSATGMTSGTRVTLQYAKDWGYRACPYCNPPTSIE